MAKIRFTFYGGCQEVGKSAVQLSSGGLNVMLDYGMKLTTPPQVPLKPDHVDCVLLSHSHMDHSGMIPALRKWFTPPIYSTDLNFELSHILQEDTLKISKIGGYPLEYSREDVEGMVESEIPVGYNKLRNVYGKFSFEFYDAGHIPGSCGVLLNIEGKQVFYTGDVRLSDTRLLCGAKFPEADVLVMESTYGDRNHPPREQTEKDFIGAVESTLDGGGVALVPAFAVGRSQELLMVLRDFEYPVYLDGMSQAVTKIMLGNEDYRKYLRDPKELQSAVENSVWVENRRDRKRVCSEPCVIVTTAGMLHGGPVLSYLGRLHENPKNSVLLTGYQVEGTNGRMLLDEGYVVDLETGRKISVDAGVYQFDFSAHADQRELLGMVDKINPKTVVVVHGDPQSCVCLAGLLEGRFEVYVPKIGDSVDL